MTMPTYNLRRRRVEPAKLVWLRSGEGTLTRLHAEATVGLAIVEDHQALLIAAARGGDPIAEHLLATVLRGRVWTAEGCRIETARRIGGDSALRGSRLKTAAPRT